MSAQPTAPPAVKSRAALDNARLLAALRAAEPALGELDPAKVLLAVAALRKRLRTLGRLDFPLQ